MRRTLSGDDRARRAFTLLELVAVIVILGLLAAVAAVAYNSVVDRANTAALTTTGQAFEREVRALAALEGQAPAEAVAVAVADLPRGWTATPGVADDRKVLLIRADGAWACVHLGSGTPARRTGPSR